ncbi:LOW QUALITY PROTEIN: hypothetical protein PHMEG_00019811 [Phytophthora megakarya]|uniref:Peptidase A2 domain-containing protein n=1 Tax=Phytophthora megakarya TaxID=4795 RepID=A0A225VTA3_9STRA|nr:LOW QUALITY PROTEIN: hypothetical protein PHMEG_00019811 [Phytophthora megakarya]
MATSEYLASRMSSGAPAQIWIPEWSLVRLAPNMAADFTSVTLSMRECVAVLPTMFFEVGFKFRNLVPEWFRVSTPKAEVDTMRRVAEELQHLLTQVISGVQCRGVSPLDARNPNDRSEEMKSEDAEGDSLMPNYEAELLGTQRGVTQPESSLGVQVTETVHPAPPIPANLDDVVMSESGRAIIRSGNRSRTSRKYIHRVQRRRSETPALEAFKAFIRTVAKSVDQVRDDNPLRKKGLNDQWESVMSAQMQRLQEEITSLKEVRNQDQKAIRSSKNVRGTSASNTRATSTEVQDVRSTVSPRSSNAIKDDAVHNQDTCGDSAFAAQFQLTLPSTTKTKYEKGNVLIKGEQGSRIAKTNGPRVKSRQTETKSTGAARSEDKEPSKKEPRKKLSRRDEDPQDPARVAGPARRTTAQVTPTARRTACHPTQPWLPTWEHAYSPDVHQRTGCFDEKQSLTARHQWWEKFLNMTIKAGWTDQMNIYEFKTKMLPAARNWMGQLGKRGTPCSRVQAQILQVGVSDSEKYYTMKLYKDETALVFLYRLNLAAERADVKFRKSERRREQHIKRFIKKLTDMSLRSMQCQRFYKVSDLEYVLKQQEEVNASRTTSPEVECDRRNSNRAYMAQDDEGVDVEQPTQVEQDVDEDDAALQELSAAIQDAHISDNPNGVFLSREELIHEVYHIMNNVGCKTANPNARSGSSANPRPPVPPPAQPAAFQRYQSYDNPDRLEFCKKCKKFGHRPEKCWTDMICGQCHRRGHPTRSCMTKSCPKCEEYRDGHCEEWKAFQEIKKLVLQGGLADLPSNVREDILKGKDNSEKVHVSGPPLPPEPEGKPEFKLNPGERYGWWVENDREEVRRQCATDHGAVNNFRTQILLDTGATVSMISLDLARRLKIKLNSQKRIKVSGLGGVRYISSSGQIKITLG